MSDCRDCANYGGSYCKCNWISPEDFEENYRTGKCRDFEEEKKD